MSDGAPLLGIVIVNYNTRALLAACLGSIARELERLGLDPTGQGAKAAEVWVVDNASPDGSAAMVARDAPWARLLALDENVGFTAGNNRVLAGWSRAGAAKGCPRFVLLLNPDAELTEGSLARLLKTLRDDPAAGAVGPALRYPDGRFQHAAFRFPGVVQTVLDLWPIPRLADAPINGRYARARYASGAPFRVDFVLGACLLMTGAALRAVGPLDEGFVMYCEEIDWCRRAADRGFATLCEPRAIVIHHGGAASSQRRASATAHLWRSRLRWFALHASPRRARLLRSIIRAGLWWRERSDARALARGEITTAERSELRAAYRDALAAPER